MWENSWGCHKVPHVALLLVYRSIIILIPCLPSPLSGVRLVRFQMRANQGLTGYHSKGVFITQKKLLDKAVLIRKR
jgi:hypothetical protein